MRNLAPFPVTEPDFDLQEEETADARGWDGLAEWTGGLPPDQVEALAAVRELEAVYPLLHALVGRSPRELFRRVLEMMGDQDVLERYGEARRRYAESEQEVSRQMYQVQGLQMDLQKVERLVADLDDWERNRDRVADLEDRAQAETEDVRDPRARLQIP